MKNEEKSFLASTNYLPSSFVMLDGALLLHTHQILTTGRGRRVGRQTDLVFFGSCSRVVVLFGGGGSTVASDGTLNALVQMSIRSGRISKRSA